LSKLAKYSAICLLVMLASTILLAAANAQDETGSVPNPWFPPSPPPTGQEKARVVVIATMGGTVDPAPGTYTYNYADTITLTATPDSGYTFLYWAISEVYNVDNNQPPITYPQGISPDDPNYMPDFPSSSAVAQNNLVTSTNPLAVICGYGYTFQYEAVFAPTETSSSGNNAVVVLVDSVGGSTDPGPGTYMYADGTTINLKATPDDGYEFVQWVAVGADGHPATFTENPTAITCGYGYTYRYQAMFAPTGSTTTTTEGIPATYFYVIVIVLVIIAIIGLGAALMYRGKSKSK
jgi:hypothetical protein